MSLPNRIIDMGTMRVTEGFGRINEVLVKVSANEVDTRPVGALWSLVGFKAGVIAFSNLTLPPNGWGYSTFAVPGAAVGDVLLVNPPANIPPGLVYAGCGIHAANQGIIYLHDAEGANLTNGLGDPWRYLHFDLTP